MTTPTFFVGVDPGPIPGIVALSRRGRHLDIDVMQCSATAAATLLWAVLDSMRPYGGKADALVQIERFVVARRAGRSSSASAGEATRDLVGKLQREAAAQPNVDVVMRSAAAVKPWATDERLDRAGLLDATKGMRHARDAARHALFAACHDGGLTDPLSKEFIR